MSASNVERMPSRPPCLWDIEAIVEGCSGREKGMWDGRKSSNPGVEMRAERQALAERPLGYVTPRVSIVTSRALALSPEVVLPTQFEGGVTRGVLLVLKYRKRVPSAQMTSEIDASRLDGVVGARSQK